MPAWPSSRSTSPGRSGAAAPDARRWGVWWPPPGARFRDPLEGLGYVHREDPEEPAHRFFGLSDAAGRRLVNIHVCESGGEWERRHLTFRDLLRTRPDVAVEYERLKRDLAPRYQVVDDYADAKGDFIRRLLRRFTRPAPGQAGAPP